MVFVLMTLALERTTGAILIRLGPQVAAARR
jgi:hypothetical protein